MTWFMLQCCYVVFRPLSNDDITTGNKIVFRAPGVNVLSCCLLFYAVYINFFVNHVYTIVLSEQCNI